jgi:hypothetical protein
MSVTAAVRDSRMSLPIMPKAPGSVNAAPPSPGFGKTLVIPAKAGIQRRSSKDTGFPLTRE